MYARGLSTRDIEALFADADGHSLLSRTAVSEITERLWAEYEGFAGRELAQFEVVYLFVDGIAERLHLGQPREAVLAAWGLLADGKKALLHLAPATRDAGLHLPLAPTVGFLVFTPPVAASLSRVVRTTVIHARPDGAGRLMLHWNPTDATLSFDTRLSPSMPEARDLMRRARQLLPSIGQVEPEAVRLAIRPIPGDQLSAIGPMPRTSGYYIAITHSGVTMSPFLGAAVADEVVRGRERAELADFRPARFFN